MKVLVATEKPFAAAAVEGIKKEIEGAGNELVLLEKYTEKAQLLDAVKDVDAMIIRSDKEISACNFLPQRWAARKNPSGKSKMLSSRYAENCGRYRQKNK